MVRYGTVWYARQWRCKQLFISAHALLSVDLSTLPRVDEEAKVRVVMLRRWLNGVI